METKRIITRALNAIAILALIALTIIIASDYANRRSEFNQEGKAESTSQDITQWIARFHSDLFDDSQEQLEIVDLVDQFLTDYIDELEAD